MRLQCTVAEGFKRCRKFSALARARLQLRGSAGFSPASQSAAFRASADARTQSLKEQLANTALLRVSARRNRRASQDESSQLSRLGGHCQLNDFLSGSARTVCARPACCCRTRQRAKAAGLQALIRTRFALAFQLPGGRRRALPASAHEEFPSPRSRATAPRFFFDQRRCTLVNGLGISMRSHVFSCHAWQGAR